MDPPHQRTLAEAAQRLVLLKQRVGFLLKLVCFRFRFVERETFFDSGALVLRCREIGVVHQRETLFDEFEHFESVRFRADGRFTVGEGL